MSTPINITIDGHTVLDAVQSCNIKMAENQYCMELDLTLLGIDWFSICDPTTNAQTARAHVYIGDADYAFLIEDRSTTPTDKGIATTIWGRSLQALAGPGMATSIADTDGANAWQSTNMMATEIVDAVKGDLSVTWNAIDFPVYAGTLTIENQTPIEIISSLAAVIGAQIHAEIDGSLSIDDYEADTSDTPSISYTDIDDIISISEQHVATDGFNAVIIIGYGAANNSAYLSFEEYDPDENLQKRTDWGLPNSNVYAASIAGESVGNPFRGGTATPTSMHATWRQYQPIILKLCAWHPQETTPTIYYADGHAAITSILSETITEDVELIWGSGNQSKPDTSGNTSVIADTSIPFAMQSVSYTNSYYLVSITPFTNGQHAVVAYFDDNSTSAIHRFDVYDENGCPDIPGIPNSNDGWELCESIVVEKISPETVALGNTVKIGYYGYGVPGYGKDYNNNEVSVSGGPVTVEQSETVIFTNGQATLAYPLETLTSITFTADGVSADPQSYPKSKLLKVPTWQDNPAYYRIQANVIYNTAYTPFDCIMPSAWPSTEYGAYFTPTDTECDTKEITWDITDADAEDQYQDVTLTIHDYHTQTIVAGASITVDGVYKGDTDAEGQITITHIEIGDHTLKITADGYVDSDLDQLSNDTFTVTAS